MLQMFHHALTVRARMKGIALILEFTRMHAGVPKTTSAKIVKVSWKAKRNRG